ncbi:MAG: TolC family protein [Aquificota bacterium]|nr:MAG: TolC family protein [Aquificota bacterium]
MRLVVLILTLGALAFAQELSLESAIRLALENSPLIKASKRELKAQELEVRSAEGMLFPRLKLEETFTRTDIPAYAFMSKLNQERIGPQDFDPRRLNNPSSVNNFETKLSLEVPIWMGGKVQSAIKLAKHEYRALSFQDKRREEEVIKEVYNAYINAVYAKASIEVAKQAVRDAQEHLRLAENMHKVGMALLSDVLRAKVYLSKAEENLQKAQRGYETAKKGLELVIGKPLGEFDVVDFGYCPTVEREPYLQKAVQRSDIKALEERLKLLEESYRFVLSENLPQVYAFANYNLYSKNTPFGGDGGGYMVGLGISWSIDTGLSTLRKAQANLERKKALQEQLKFLKDKALFEVEKAYREYLNSIDELRSAESRVKASEEVVRVMELRYRNGLARIVDLLDAQTELDKARLERVQAIKNCHSAYVELLFASGSTREVLP